VTMRQEASKSKGGDGADAKTERDRAPQAGGKLHAAAGKLRGGGEAPQRGGKSLGHRMRWAERE